MTMKISDKEAYRLLGLPLGVDKEAIMKKYKKLSIALSASRRPEDKKKLEMVIAAYNRLLPQPSPHNQNHKGQTGPSNGVDSEGSSKDNSRVLCRNGDARSLPKDGEMTEEERERKRAEKKKEKKRRQKEKKKLEKIETQVLTQKIANNNHIKKKEESPSEEEEEEEDEDEEEEEWEEGQGIDPNSAFVAAAAAKKGVLGGAQGKERPPRSTPQPPTSPQHHPHHHHHQTPPRIATNTAYVNSTVANPSGSASTPVNNVTREAVVIGQDVVVTKAAREQACQLARRGNDAASVGSYVAAVQLFTDAIFLDPTDPRFLGNRSYCFNQLGHHEKALEDADRAVSLEPQSEKWHFRRGTPLKDLGRYVEAEEAFKEVLRHDPGCREAQEEVMRVRAARIAEMGFTKTQAISSIAKYSNVQPALDALLAGEFKEVIELTFQSGNTESPPRKPQGAASRDIKMNPQNPEGLMSLWVGNIVPDVTEKALTQLFASQGQVTSVRILGDKHCAFVNFANRGDAGRAMAGLQGYQFHGQKLLIKFPDNPITSGFHRGGGSGGSNQHLNQSVVRRGNGLDGGGISLHSSISSTGSSPASSSSSSPGPPSTSAFSSTHKKNTFNGEVGNGGEVDIGTTPPESPPAYYHNNITTNNTANQVPSTQPNQPNHQTNGDVSIAKNGVGLGLHMTQPLPQPLLPPAPLSHPGHPAQPKLKGPVNGGECYFWRTTGCKFGDSCRYMHLSENQGVDRKPWQK